jgi:hypothetical protein
LVSEVLSIPQELSSNPPTISSILKQVPHIWFAIMAGNEK